MGRYRRVKKVQFPGVVPRRGCDRPETRGKRGTGETDGMVQSLGLKVPWEVCDDRWEWRSCGFRSRCVGQRRVSPSRVSYTDRGEWSSVVPVVS